MLQAALFAQNITMNSVTFKPIGTIYTPFTSLENMPIQPSGAQNMSGYILLDENFTKGLKDIEGFSHLTLIYHFNKVNDYELEVVPFMDSTAHGIFATRSPKRPNPIGISTVKLTKVDGNKLFIEEVDMLNETPLLDIKPFFRQSDNRPNAISGWLDNKKHNAVVTTKSDKRFNS